MRARPGLISIDRRGTNLSDGSGCRRGATRTQSGNGPLVRVVLFDLGPGGQRLLFVVHHLVVDGVSWRILLEDWEHVYRKLQSGERVELPLKTTSFQRWAKRLDQLAQTRELQRELDYWTTASQHTSSLPVDAQGANTEGAHVRGFAFD